MDVVWLDFLCPRCHGEVEAQFMSWQLDGARDDDAVWTCPYCGTKHSLGVAGHVALITKKLPDNDWAVNQW